MPNPLLSIIIPTFNVGRCIRPAFDSILQQSLKNYEIIIVDGGSLDNTMEIIENYVQSNACIRYISEKDEGVYDAMNKGVKLAKGRWIYFMGADDRLFANSTLNEIFQTPAIDTYNVLYGNVQIVGNPSWAKDGDIYDGEFDLKKLLKGNICHQGIFYKRDFVKEVGFYNTDYKLCADWDYNLRCWSKTTFLYLDKVVAYFFAGGESTRSNGDKVFWDSFLPNLIRYFSLSPFDPLINNESFAFYYDVLALQKRNNYFKYLLNRIKSKFSHL